MLSSITQFPRQELIASIRNQGTGFQLFLNQIKSLNIQWIYQTLKHLSNTIVQSKQPPETKLTALKLLKMMLQTCSLPVLALIQVYILPLLYEISIYKPHMAGPQRGNRFFIDNGYSHRTPNIQESGKNFVRLSTEIIFVGGYIKRKRLLQNQELSQQSEFVDYYNKLNKYAIEGTPNSPNDLKFFNPQEVPHLSQKYKEQCKRFEPLSEDYSSFFVLKMIESLQSQENVLFTPTKTTSSLSNDLDMKKLLKYGDTYVTSPLIQEISDGLQSSQNFIVKRNFLSIFSDLIKWADIEAIIQLNYDDLIESIAGKIAQVNGNLGISEGENIYPEIKGQRQGKKKFYIQFLKSIDIWARILVEEDILQDAQKASQLYHYFKNERGFVFPQNLMMKRIEQDFEKCKIYNHERNQEILKKLKLDESSMLNNRKSKSINRESFHESIREEASFKRPKIKFAQLKQQLENRIDDFITLCEEQDQIDTKMMKLTHFKDNFDQNLENIEEQPSENQLIEAIDEGDALINNIKELLVYYNDYKNNKISLERFSQVYEAQIDALQSKNSMSYSNSKSVGKSKNLPNQQALKSSENMMVLNSLNQNSLENNSHDFEHREAKQSAEYITKQNKNQYNKHSQDIVFEEFSDNNQSSSYQSISKSGQKSGSFAENQKPSVSQELNKSNRREGQADIQNKISQLQDKSLYSNSNQQYEQFSGSNSSAVMQRSQQKNSSYYHNQQVQSKQSLNQSQSIKDKISQHRASRGDASFSSSYRRKNSGFLNKSQRSEANSSFRDNINANYVNDQQSITNNDQKYNIINKDQSFKDSRDFGANKKSKLDYSHHQSRISSSKNSFSGRNSSVSSSRERPKIFKKDSKLSQQSQSSRQVSNIIKNNEQKVRAEYYMQSQPSSSHKSQQQESSLSINPSKHSSKKSRINLNHEQYVYEENGKYKSNLSKRSLIKDKNQSSIIKKPRQITENIQQSHEISEQYSAIRYHAEPVEFNDLIKQPDPRQLNQSYYGAEEIYSKVIKSKNPQFKDCYKIDKDILPVLNKQQQMVTKSLQKGILKQQKSVKKHQYSRNSTQEEYLMMKLHKQVQDDRTQQLNQMGQKVYRLKSENSKLQSQVSSQRIYNQLPIGEKNSSYNSSSSFHDFASKKSASSYKSSNSNQKFSRSKNSMTSLEGRLLNMNIYEQFFMSYDNESIKKCLLRNKSLLFKNSDIQIGFLSKKEKNALKIMLFITPETAISDLHYQISSQRNISCNSYPEGYKHIEEKKQVKVTILLEAQAFPFNLPQIQLTYTLPSRQKKTQKLFIPSPIHKFFQFKAPSNLAKFGADFESSHPNIIKTNQFKVKRKIVRFEDFREYFPGLVVIRKQDGMVKYGAICANGKQQFSLMMLTQGSNYLTLFGYTPNETQFIEYFMSSLKQILSA